VTGDYNGDGIVNAIDYTMFRDRLGSNNALPNDNGLGVPISNAHYALWRSNFGNPGSGSGGGSAVPEPASLLLIAISMVGMMTSSRRRE
jgi:hypothetical protein